MPWDPLAKEWPEHVAMPLGPAFLAEWAGDPPDEDAAGRLQPSEEVVLDPEAREEAQLEAARSAEALTAEEERWNALVDELEAAEAHARGREVEVRSIQAEISGNPERAGLLERTVTAAEEQALAAKLAAAMTTGGLRGRRWRKTAELTERERAILAERLEVTKEERRALLRRLREAEEQVARAREVVERLREREWRLREEMAPRREAAMRAAERLLMMERFTPSGLSPVFDYVTVARGHHVLGTMSLGEWRLRAAGHGRSPRFVMEFGGESLWLFEGEWYAADTDLRADDVLMLISGDLPVDVDPQTAALVWERDRGRCVRCGALGGLMIDLVVPLALGGGDAPSNFRLLCRNCARERAHNR